MFSFGAYENPPPASYSGFFQAVTAPILRRIFELVLVRFGPKVVAARDLTFQITEEQGGSVKETHELVTAIKRREVTVAQALRLAMPKSMYWSATAMMTSHVLEQLWAWVFALSSLMNITLKSRTHVSSARSDLCTVSSCVGMRFWLSMLRNALGWCNGPINCLKRNRSLFACSVAVRNRFCQWMNAA